jgi:hypothetical protein
LDLHTYYTDWYFGLGQLLPREAGGCGDSFPALHLCVSTIRGDYFSHCAMPDQDLMQVAQLGLDRTTTANLLSPDSAVYLRSAARSKVFLSL